jgi:hypothetical protein
VSTTKAVPMSMVFQVPRGFMSIGMFQDAGLREVPEATSIRDIPAAFISTIVGVLGMFMPGMLGWATARAARVRPNTIIFTEISWGRKKPLEKRLQP